MKILWIARTCPFPANDGEKLRVFNLLKALASKHELTVICRVMNAEEEAGLAELRKFCVGGVHGVHVPSPRNTWQRVRQLMPFVFSSYPVALCTVFFAGILEVLRRLADTQRFDIVQVEHSSLTIYLDHVRFKGDPAKVLTMHNVDYLRNQRIIENTPFGPTKLYHLLNQSRFKHWELASLERYDTVIAMSEFDKQAMLADRPGLKVFVVPNGVDCQRIPFTPAVDPGHELIFVASMDSEANHDGAMFFLDRVYPLLLRTHPEATVSFVGRNPRPELASRHEEGRITVTGKVDDVFPYYRTAAVSIVPLRSGGGTRLKILEAMAVGAPVVSTTVGAEGLEVVPEEHLLIADEPGAFAAAIARLLEDAGMRQALIRRAREQVEQHYDWALIAEHHDEVYQVAVRDAKA